MNIEWLLRNERRVLVLPAMLQQMLVEPDIRRAAPAIDAEPRPISKFDRRGVLRFLEVKSAPIFCAFDAAADGRLAVDS